MPAEVISMRDIALSVGEDNEHPLARRVWHTMAMQRWREEYKKAVDMDDYLTMDYLDGQYERIQAV